MLCHPHWGVHVPTELLILRKIISSDRISLPYRENLTCPIFQQHNWCSIYAQLNVLFLLCGLCCAILMIFLMNGKTLKGECYHHNKHVHFNIICLIQFYYYERYWTLSFRMFLTGVCHNSEWLDTHAFQASSIFLKRRAAMCREWPRFSSKRLKEVNHMWLSGQKQIWKPAPSLRLCRGRYSHPFDILRGGRPQSVLDG
jgi:hypothetical protein